MNNNSKSLIFYKTLLVLVFINVWIGVLSAYGQSISVSITSLNMKPKERVVGFDVCITSGRIARLSDFPIGWSISVDNDASWNAVAKGSATVGAAAIDINYFQKFMVIEKNESLGIPFDMKGEVIVTSDFAAERRIKFVLKNLTIKGLTGKVASDR